MCAVSFKIFIRFTLYTGMTIELIEERNDLCITYLERRGLLDESHWTVA